MPAASRRPGEEDAHVRERAEKLWREAGRPSGGASAYLDEAKTLVAIEDNPKAGQESIKEGYNKPGPWVNRWRRRRSRLRMKANSPQ